MLEKLDEDLDPAHVLRFARWLEDGAELPAKNRLDFADDVGIGAVHRGDSLRHFRRHADSIAERTCAARSGFRKVRSRSHGLGVFRIEEVHQLRDVQVAKKPEGYESSS